MMATSLKPAAEVFTSPPRLWGSELRWQNYREAFTFLPFGRFVLNGFAVAPVGVEVGGDRFGKFQVGHVGLVRSCVETTMAPSNRLENQL